MKTLAAHAVEWARKARYMKLGQNLVRFARRRAGQRATSQRWDCTGPVAHWPKGAWFWCHLLARIVTFARTWAHGRGKKGLDPASQKGPSRPSHRKN